MTEEVPSALSASRNERASGFPSMIQFGRIGSGTSSTSAGAAKRIGSDMALPPESHPAKRLGAERQKTVKSGCSMRPNPGGCRDPEKQRFLLARGHPARADGGAFGLKR